MNKVIGIIIKKEKVLIGKVKLNKIKDFGGIKYVFPGGSVEDNETIEQAVVREIKEETGLDANILDNLGKRTHPVTGKTIHYFICEATSDELNTNDPLNDDLEELIWIDTTVLRDYMPTVFNKVISYFSTDDDVI